MPVIDENNSNYVQLPYTLTEGVTATLEELVFNRGAVAMLMGAAYDVDADQWILMWPDAAERLWYRDGDPYCESFVLNRRAGSLICAPPYEGVASAGIQLHRLAAILCDDAEAFRVLHWCIHNLCKPVEIDGVTYFGQEGV